MDAEPPVVGVVVVEQALGVVGADERRVDAQAGQVLVATLNDEIAGGGIDVDLFVIAPLRRIRGKDFDAVCEQLANKEL